MSSVTMHKFLSCLLDASSENFNSSCGGTAEYGIRRRCNSQILVHEINRRNLIERTSMIAGRVIGSEEGCSDSSILISIFKSVSFVLCTVSRIIISLVLFHAFARTCVLAYACVNTPLCFCVDELCIAFGSSFDLYHSVDLRRCLAQVLRT